MASSIAAFSKQKQSYSAPPLQRFLYRRVYPGKAGGIKPPLQANCKRRWILNSQTNELWFTYVTPFQALLAGADSGTLSVSINRGGDFILERVVAVSTGGFKSQIGDGGISLLFSNDLVDSTLLFGTAQLWMPVIPAYKFPANGSISWRVVDTSAAANTIQLGFIGRIVGIGTAQPQAATGHPKSQGAAAPNPPGGFVSADSALAAFYNR